MELPHGVSGNREAIMVRAFVEDVMSMIPTLESMCRANASLEVFLRHQVLRLDHTALPARSRARQPDGLCR